MSGLKQFKVVLRRENGRFFKEAIRPSRSIAIAPSHTELRRSNREWIAFL